MHGPRGYLMLLDRLHGQFGEDPLRSCLKKEIQNPAHRVVVERAGWNTLPQEELGVTAFMELHQTIERRSPRESIHDKPQNDAARFDLHLRRRETVDRLHQVQIICKGLDVQEMVNLLGVDIQTARRINRKPWPLGLIQIEFIGIRTHPASDTALEF
jgi:hypothetical protein